MPMRQQQKLEGWRVEGHMQQSWWRGRECLWEHSYLSEHSKFPGFYFLVLVD